MTTYENAKVHFESGSDHPDDEGYATVYEEVEVLESGWVRCGTEPHGPQLYPPRRIKEVDAGHDG